MAGLKAAYKLPFKSARVSGRFRLTDPERTRHELFLRVPEPREASGSSRALYHVFEKAGLCQKSHCKQEPPLFAGGAAERSLNR